MICKMCATGADMQRRALEIKEEYKGQDSEMSEALTKYGKKIHTKCKGGTQCDCQHEEVVPRRTTRFRVREISLKFSEGKSL